MYTLQKKTDCTGYVMNHSLVNLLPPWPITSCEAYNSIEMLEG